MPIFLTTGMPGAGKSLNTLWVVEARRKSENREVFYNGITDLNLPWTQFDDSAKWYELPKGCIIVIDECQRLFRLRASKDVPMYVSELETHRHNGYDIYLVTQHPTLIEPHVRKLVDTHRHLMRKFGARWATVHEWKGVKDNCDKTRKDSMESEFRYPKEVFTWYKSAEVHTFKFKLPSKVIMLMVLPVVIGLAVWLAVFKLDKIKESGVDGKASKTATAGPTGAAGDALPPPPPRTAATIFASLQPRIEGHPWTASRYDGLTQPVRVPVIVGCILIGPDQSKGFCITQQGSRVNAPLAVVKAWMVSPTFVDYDRGPDVGESGGGPGKKSRTPAAGQPQAIASN